MNSFLYFLCAVVLLTGLLLIGGYLGRSDAHKSYSISSDMSKLVNGQSPVDGDQNGTSSGGGCTSCRWY
jgi:hypothetical protein